MASNRPKLTTNSFFIISCLYCPLMGETLMKPSSLISPQDLNPTKHLERRGYATFPITQYVVWRRFNTWLSL